MPRKHWVSTAAGIALSVAIAVPAATAEGANPMRTLVMPFDPGHEPRAYWLGEASAVLLADALRSLGVDAIGRDERIRAFTRLQVPSVATLTHGTVIRVGQLVGASSVVVGSVALDGETIAVRARSIRLDTGRLQAEVQESARADELFALYQRVARRLIPGGGGNPTPPADGPPLAAFENYIKGLLAETPAAQAAFLEKAIDLFPEYDVARLALWHAYTEAEQPDQARAAATALVTRAPGNDQAVFAAAYSEIQLRQYDEAYRRLRALAERAPLPPVFNNLGVIQARRGSTPETGKATYWFNRAAAENPVDPDYFFNLGYAYWLDEDRPAAIYWLREALRRDPADAEAHFVIAHALRTAGSATEADRELELARRLSADYERASPAGAGVARGLERTKLTLDAEGERIDSALVAPAQREQRELASFHLDRGRRLYESAQDDEAIVELRRTLYLSPYHSEAHLLLGRIYIRRGRLRDAIDALKISLWSSETVDARVALAEVLIQQHEPEAARREIARALELDPKAPGAAAMLERLDAQR